jgi:hypothetical protein
VRRKGIARFAVLHLDCARSPKRGRYRFHAADRSRCSTRRAFDNRPRLCYVLAGMVTRLTLTVCMLAALFVSAVRLPASACPVSSPPIGQACKPGSCPNKACCAQAEKNKSLPSPPLAKDDSTSQHLVAVVAPAITAFVMPVRADGHRADLSAHVLAYSATPKRTLLCTFLI